MARVNSSSSGALFSVPPRISPWWYRGNSNVESSRSRSVLPVMLQQQGGGQDDQEQASHGQHGPEDLEGE